MKILLNCATPFSLAHGGAEIQIKQTHAALTKLGADVDFLRWFDSDQRGDILHHFGRPSSGLIKMAQSKGVRVISTAFESGFGAKPRLERFLMSWFRRIAGPLIIRNNRDYFAWRAYSSSDAAIAMTPYEADLLRTGFDVPPGRIHFVPNGVEDVFLLPHEEVKGEWLVCAASILPLKQVVKLARMAILAETPIWFIGKPFSESDAYYQEFLSLAKSSRFLRYEGPIGDRNGMAVAYRRARGFVLISKWESLSLAALEAASCGCPLLLSDLPWATRFFGPHATYCPPVMNVEGSARILRTFYDDAPQLPVPPRPESWEGIGRRLLKVYAQVYSSPPAKCR
jgi:glycosyltransferase involved in cell wall biosynthesis